MAERVAEGFDGSGPQRRGQTQSIWMVLCAVVLSLFVAFGGVASVGAQEGGDDGVENGDDLPPIDDPEIGGDDEEPPGGDEEPPGDDDDDPVPTVPGSPTAVTAGAGSGRNILVSWEAPSDGAAPTNYRVVLRSGTTQIGAQTLGATARQHTFGSLAPGSYVAEVSALAGDTEGPKQTRTVTLGYSTPKSVTVTASGHEVTVTWQAPDNPRFLDRYQVTLQGPGAPDTPIIVDNLAQKLEVKFDVTAPGTYSARVRSQYGPDHANGGHSDSGSATIASPSGPRIGSTQVDGTSVEFSWLEPSVNPDFVTEYRVEVTPKRDGVLITFDPDRATDGRFIGRIEGLPAGTYTIRVVAVASGTDISSSSVSNIRIVVPPGAPQRVTATDGVHSTKVSWAPPSNFGNGTISTYRIDIRQGTQVVTTKTVAANQRSVTFNDLAAGRYTALVYAVNERGQSAEAGGPAQFQSRRTFHPFDARDNFVRQAFRDIMGHNPDAWAMWDWASTTRPDGSNAPDQIVAMMNHSDLDIDRLVARLYLAYFRRQPDKAGHDYWVQLIRSRQASIHAVSAEFAASPEFRNTYGPLTDAEFIATVYWNVMTRPADQPGFAYWYTEIVTGRISRANMMIEFSESPEYRNTSRHAVDISLFHMRMLGRSQTKFEHAQWRDRLYTNKARTRDLALHLLMSDEYAARINP